MTELDDRRNARAERLDFDALALADFLAGLIRGDRKISDVDSAPEDGGLPASARKLLVGYLAQRDYGTAGVAEQPTGLRFMGNPVRGRFTVRDRDGRPVPPVPRLSYWEPEPVGVIDDERTRAALPTLDGDVIDVVDQTGEIIGQVHGRAPERDP